MITINDTLHTNADTAMLKAICPDTDSICFFDIETTGFSRNYNIVYLIGAVYFGRRGAQRDPLDGRIGIAGALHRVAQVVDRSDAERSELLQPARRDIAQARASEYPAAPDTAAIRRAVAAEVAQIVKAFKVNAIHISS